jgi:hypothetical protein
MLTLSLFAMLAGCRQNVDLSSIRDLSAAVKAAEPSYAAIADDLYQSCLRQQQWTFTGNFLLETPSKAALLSPKELTSETKKALDTAKAIGHQAIDCGLLQASSERWRAVDNVLTSFYTQLGAAAGDDSNSDFGLTKLADAVPVTSADQKLATANAAKSLAKALYAMRRRDLVAAQAADASSAVTYYVNVLTKVADDYKRELDLERDTIDSFFSRNFIAQDVGLQTLETLRFRQDWKTALSDVDTKESAANAYERSLKALDGGTSAIVNKASENDFAGVDAVVAALTAEIKPNLVALQKAFR